MKNTCKPSMLGHTYCLTGDRNTEIAIEAIVAACASRGDRWQAIEVNSVNIGSVGRANACPFAKWTVGGQVNRTAEADHRRLLGMTTAGRFLIRAVEDGWAEFIRVGDLLGIQLTEMALQRIQGRL